MKKTIPLISIVISLLICTLLYCCIPGARESIKKSSPSSGEFSTMRNISLEVANRVEPQEKQNVEITQRMDEEERILYVNVKDSNRNFGVESKFPLDSNGKVDFEHAQFIEYAANRKLEIILTLIIVFIFSVLVFYWIISSFIKKKN